ncbi:MAG TPA: MFS transporter [Streptosporangiaceae bacterium]|nr:MFS transporter [Streptosporangiaceae bacterium]
MTGGAGSARPAVTGPARSSTFQSLRKRNYRLFASGQVISNSGTWMQRVAQDWLVLQLTHGSGTALGIATGLQFLPMLLFGLWGGAIADRYNKRHILMITQTVMGLLALVLGLLAVTGVVRIWEVYALAFGLGLATVVDNPTRQSFVTEMVGPAHMPNAIALNSAIFNLARIAGPAIAGLVIGVAGTPVAFFINAASYGAVLTGLKLMRPSELNPVPPVQRAKGQLVGTLRYVWSRPALLMPMVLVFFVSTFGMNFQVTNALMSRQVFHTGATAFGVASAVFAAGALAGALLAARRSRPGPRLLVTAAFLFGILEVLGGLMPSFWAFLLLLIPTGLVLLTLNTAANSTTQLGTAPDMRGRVMGLYMLVFLGGTPIGSPLIGWVAEVFGPRMSVVVGGGISAAAAAVIGLLLARSRGVRATEYLRPAALAKIFAWSA